MVFFIFLRTRWIKEHTYIIFLILAVLRSYISIWSIYNTFCAKSLAKANWSDQNMSLLIQEYTHMLHVLLDSGIIYKLCIQYTASVENLMLVHKFSASILLTSSGEISQHSPEHGSESCSPTYLGTTGNIHIFNNRQNQCA